ncbi:MAG: NAD(+) diphosphatase [Clostridia bacterium]|nr:NAD(+) diphosphatase [Clostridia bacterium]
MMLHEIYPHKFDITYTQRKASDNDFIVICKGNGILVKEEDDGIILPRVKNIYDSADTDGINELRFLFTLDGDIGVYKAEVDSLDGFAPVSPRELRTKKPMWISYAAVVAFRLNVWYKDTKFCGRCGSPMTHSDSERAMICSNAECKNTVYPSICPSVIVLIKDGDRALLTRYAVNHSNYRRYALVAGYVETGETPEDTVAREVYEEVGLNVKNITYYKSQPWPISGALLLGYICDLDGSDKVRLDENELETAVWVNRADIPDRSADVSLTSELMEMFRTGKI